MSILLQVLTLVGAPPGSYVYHLVLLFALEAAAAIALSQWWKNRDTARARLSLAAGGVFVLRLLPLFAALLAVAGLLDPLTALPPLDRAISTLSLLFIIWAFAFPDSQHAADAALAGFILLTLLAFGISWLLWANEAVAGATFYNGSLQDTGWEIAQAALMALGLLLLLIRRKSDWLLGLGVLGLLVAGHLFHLLRPVQFANIPHAARLAELLALPIFTAMIYRRAHAPALDLRPTTPLPVLAQEAPPAPAAEAPVEPAPRPRAALDPKAAAALASLSAASSLQEMAQLLPLALAHTFRADLCLLITPPDASGLATIACGYDLIREKFLPGASLAMSDVPDLAAALYQGQPARLTPDEHQTELRHLSGAVGVDQIGPARMIPFLSEEGALLAAVVLISVYARREWSPEEEQLMDALIEPIAAALGLAEKTARFNLEAEARQADAERLTADLSAARAEAERLALELDRTQAEMDQQREEAEALTRELKAQHESEADEINTLRANLQQAQREAEEHARLEAELETVTREADEYKQRAAALEAELERARTEAVTPGVAAAAGEAATTAALTASPEVERLQAELEIAQRQAKDRERLEEELQDALDNFHVQTSLAADLQMELTGYKMVESQLRKELDLTRAELKRLTERAEAGRAPAQTDDRALAQTQAALAAAIGELAEKSQALNEALEQINRKERQLSKTQATLNALSGQTKTLEELQQQLAEQERQLAEARAALTGQTGAETAIQQLAEKEKQLTDAQLLIAELYEQANALPVMRDQLADKDRQIAEARAALAQKDQQSAAALSGPAEASPQIAEAQAALAAAREQLTEQERQLAAQARDVAALARPMTTAPFSAPSYEVITSLAQELRQPMSSIVGYSDLLMGESVGILGALQQKFLERIIAACERMEGLLDDLIRVTALDSGRLKLAHDSLDVMTVVEEAILGVGAQIREKSINLRLDLADNLPAVFADRDALRQIVAHLLNNAASASAIDGEVTLSVRAEAPPPDGRAPEGLYISVRDTGGGIAPEDQPRVFSRKYRADAPLIAGLGDTAGMALFIAKALTEAQGGRIWVTSEMGQGSTFSVALPIVREPAPAGDNGSGPADR